MENNINYFIAIDKFRYWLQSIISRTSNSPVIIIGMLHLFIVNVSFLTLSSQVRIVTIQNALPSMWTTFWTKWRQELKVC